MKLVDLFHSQAILMLNKGTSKNLSGTDLDAHIADRRAKARDEFCKKRSAENVGEMRAAYRKSKDE